MDNVQNCDRYFNIPSSQTYRSDSFCSFRAACCSIEESNPMIKLNTYRYFHSECTELPFESPVVVIQNCSLTSTFIQPALWYFAGRLSRSHCIRDILSLPLTMSICNQDLSSYSCIYEPLLRHSLPLKQAEFLCHYSGSLSSQIIRQIKNIPFFLPGRSTAFQFCLPSNCPSLNLNPCFSCRRL
jgi:hypothetical protein